MVRLQQGRARNYLLHKFVHYIYQHLKTNEQSVFLIKAEHFFQLLFAGTFPTWLAGPIPLARGLFMLRLSKEKTDYFFKSF